MTFPIVDGLRSIEFGNPGESRKRLVNFVLRGNKRATAGLLKDYKAEGDLSAADFRSSHHKFWTEAGEVTTDDTLVVTLYFDLVEPHGTAG